VRKRMLERKNALSTAIITAVLAGSLAQAVIRSDGFQESRISLDNGSVWVTFNTQVGRLNLESKKIEVSLKDGKAPSGEPVDLVQAGSRLATVGSGSIRPIVDATVTFDRVVETTGSALVGLGGPADGAGEPTVVAADPTTGKVWSASADQWSSVDKATKAGAVVAGGHTGKGRPTGEVPGVAMAVGADGTAHLHRAGSDEIVEMSPSGPAVTRSIDRSVKEASISSVGATAVLLDESAQELLVPGGRTLDLSELGGAAVLQQPGPDRSSVLVATATGLWDVPFDGGAPTKRVADGGAKPIAPVWVENAKGSCAFGAWSGSARWGRWCSDLDDVATAEPLAKTSKRAEKMLSGNPLTFRVNHGRAVLNDMRSGANLLVDLPRPEVVDDWDQAQNRDKTDEEQEQQDTRKKTKTCSPTPPAPVAKADEAGTREDTPVIVPVLDNDQADACDVLTVKPYTEAELEAIDGAKVAVVDEGAAIQVIPEPGRKDEVVVPYTAVGRSGEAKANVTVTIVPDGVNNEPTTKDDETVVTAGSLSGVVHNVLVNDTDPDGDALTLIAVEDTTTFTSPRFEANGAVTYEPPGNSLAPAKITYTVTDGRGGEATGTLTVRVRPAGANAPPTPRPDRALAFVGRTTTVDVLRNDSDPDGDTLTLAGLAGEHEAVKAEHDPATGIVTFEAPPKAGRFVLETLVSDGQESETAQLVVTVLEASGNLPPVAVRDDVVARPGVPALVDLLANDVDPEGDLLAVTSVTPPPATVGSEIAVEVLEMRVARVTVPPSLDRPVPVRYTVTDGVNTAGGVLVVRPLFASAPDLAPIARADVVTVKAGGTATVAVLRNDLDPEGEQLRITDVSVVDEAQGLAFVQGDQVRIRPKPSARGAMLVNYTVKDPGGNQADSFVTVTVVDPSSPNTPPRAPSVEGRVFSGGKVEVPVPLLDLDPDGDAVHLVGLDSSRLPKLGTVGFSAGGLVYEAYAGMTGSDRFRFQVSDGRSGGVTVGTARVVVAPRPTGNTPPAAVPDRMSVRSGGERVIPVLDNDLDLDDDVLSLKDDDVEGLIQPREGNGRAELTEDRTAVRFHAPSDIGGEPITVSFSYGVTDGIDVSRGLVVVEVTPDAPKPEPPVAVDDAMTPQVAGRTVEVDVLANDRDPDGDKNALKLRAIDEPEATNIGGGRFRVKLGSTSKQFVYEITDGDGLSSRALVTIPVVTEPPLVLETPEIEIEGGKTEEIDVAAYANAKVKLERVYEETVQGLEPKGLAGTVVSMRAKPDWSRGAGFSYLVTSGQRQAIGAVRVRITGLNLPPKVTDQALEIPEGGSREVDLRKLVEDPDTAEHTFELSGGTVAGKVDATLSGSRLQVRTGKTAKGTTTTLAVTVSDGDSEVPLSLPVTVTEPVEAPPVAVADAAETNEGEEVVVDVLRNDLDPVGDGLTLVSAVVQGSQVPGTAQVRGEQVVFTPRSGSFGIARIAYTIQDSHERRAVGMVEVQVYGRPGKPSAPTGTAENGLVRIQWQPPTRGGSPVTGYVVRDESTGRTYSAPSNSYTVTGLTNGTPHRFRVAALNRVVTSEGEVTAAEWSDPSPQLIPDAAPAQMAAPVVTFDKDDNNGGNGGVLHVRWSPPPPYEGSPVTEYVVNVTPPVKGTSSFTFGASTRAHRFDGLNNGTTYAFTVRAKNDAGQNSATGGDGMSPPSAPGSEVPTGVPSAPTGVLASRTTDTRYVVEGRRADVSWTPSADDGGHPASLQYEVESIPAGFRSTKTGGTSVEASGLGQGEYQFRVLASNRAGEARAWSDPSPRVNVSGRPTVTSASMSPSNGAVHITQVNEQMNGVGSLRREVRVDGQSGFQPLPGDGLYRSGVTNGHRYSNVYVRSCNTALLAEGEGVACSEPVRATNPGNGGASWVTPYGPPPNLRGTADGGAITWTWSAQPDASTDPGGTSRRVDYGLGGPRAQSMTVTAQGQGGPTYSSTASATTQDTRSVSFRKGGRVLVSDPGYDDCTSAACYWVTIELHGFPDGGHNYSCNGDAEGSSGPFWPGSFNGNTKTKACFYGYPNNRIWIVVDGIASANPYWRDVP